MTIGKLAVILGLDSSKYESGMSKADKTASNFQTKLKAGAASMAKFAAGFAAIATAAATATAALVKFTVQQTKGLVAEADFADRVGADVNELRAWKSAAEESGVAARSLEMTWQRMTKRIGQVAEGRGPVKTFEALGLSAQRLMRMSPGEQFRTIGEAISAIGDQERRVAYLADIFDSEGVALAQMFGESMAGTSKAVDRFREVNEDVTEQQIRSARDVQASMQHLQEAWGKMWEQMGTDSASAVAAILQSVEGLVRGVTPMMRALAQAIELPAKGLAVIAHTLGADVIRAAGDDIARGVDRAQREQNLAARAARVAARDEFVRMRPERMPERETPRGRAIKSMEGFLAATVARIEQLTTRRGELRDTKALSYQLAPALRMNSAEWHRMDARAGKSNPQTVEQIKTTRELQKVNRALEEQEEIQRNQLEALEAMKDSPFFIVNF